MTVFKDSKEKIKIIENFISIEESNKIINYIDRNITNAVPWMSDGPGSNFRYFENKYYRRMFGQDDETDQYHPEKCITRLENIEDLIKKIVEKTKLKIQELYNEETQYLTSLWIAKHLTGDRINIHSDVGRGHQEHFTYSCVLYLNTVINGGDLYFPTFSFSIKPVIGNLVIFPSHNADMAHEVKVTQQDRYTMPMWFTKDPTREVFFK